MSDDPNLEPKPIGIPELDIALPVRTEIAVELSTAEGCVFRGMVSAVHVRMIEGEVEISSPRQTFLNLSRMTELDLRSGCHLELFRVENALASFRDGKLAVLATAIHPRFPV
jgi:hypothetical protein